MAEQKQILTAPPVIRRAPSGELDLVVAGHPVDGVLAIETVCDHNGSTTHIVIHNSAVIFEVEKDQEQPMN